MSSHKVPGIVEWHSNGKTYGNGCLIIFKVGPLSTHTLALSILPLLQALVEGFFWNLPVFGLHIRFDVLHGWETRPLEGPFSEQGTAKNHSE
jgi:hypothetical protein